MTKPRRPHDDFPITYPATFFGNRIHSNVTPKDKILRVKKEFLSKWDVILSSQSRLTWGLSRISYIEVRDPALAKRDDPSTKTQINRGCTAGR